MHTAASTMAGPRLRPAPIPIVRPPARIMDELAGDDGLVARAQTGDRAAFAALINRHYDFIYRVGYKWLGNQADAEDVAQNVCIKLATAIMGFDGRSKLTSWLYRLTINAAHDYRRVQKRQSKKADALASETSEAIDPDQSKHLENEDLWRAVRALPDKQRDAVLLVYAEELNHAEAAVVMGCKEATVSWYIHEAKKALKGAV